MFQTNFQRTLKKTLASFILFTFVSQPASFANRPVSTGNAPAGAERYSRALLGGHSRAEARTETSSLREQLRDIAKRMVPPNGGILAADESTGSAGKRLESVGLENTPENREIMRELMLTVPGQEKAGVNSVILYKETFGNVDRQGHNLVLRHLLGRGILPGLKTDEGLIPDPESPEEMIPNPKGLQQLPELLDKYKSQGAVFTKWRTTQTINTAKNLPTTANIYKNAAVLAKTAKITQAKGLVPIVEPEVLLDGGHDIAASYEVTTRTLQILFETLIKEGVWLDGVILKTSMILSGDKAASRADHETVGYLTLKGLLKSVPTEVPAIVFLSGGQGDDEVVQNLDAVIRASQNRFEAARDEAAKELKAEGKQKLAKSLRKLKSIPWQISYSFGRGLQRPGLKVWQGKDENFQAAQEALLQAALTTQAARQGQLKAFRSEVRLDWRKLDPSSFKIPLGLNLKKYGLGISEMAYSALQPTDETPLKTVKSQVAFGIIQAQAISAVTFAGIAEEKDKVQIGIAKKEGDANAVSLGAESIRILAEVYDVRIIVIGNEGATRDESAAIPILNIYNRDGKNGTLLFLNDSVEGTNYLVKGLPGAWAIIALLDEGNTYSTDGYRDTISYRAKRRAEINPVIREGNSLETVFAKIAGANDQTLAEWADDKHIVILGGRKRHAPHLKQLEELKQYGLTYEDIPDGDFVPRTLQASFGIRTRENREVVVIGVGGANEHKMGMVAAKLTKPDSEGRKAYAVSRYVTHAGLNDSLENADLFTHDEFEEFADTDFKIGQLNVPVALQGYNLSEVTQLESEDSIKGNAVVAATSITGARGVDLDRFSEDLNAISFIPTENQQGKIVTNSFIIDEGGNPFLIRTTYETKDLLLSRLALLLNNPFRPKETILHNNAEQAQAILDSLGNLALEEPLTLEKTREVVRVFEESIKQLDALDGYLSNDDHNLLAAEVADLEGLRQKGDLVHFTDKARQNVRPVFLKHVRSVASAIIGEPTVEVNGRRESLIRVRAEARRVADRRTIARAAKELSAVRLPEVAANRSFATSAKAVFSNKTSDALIVDANFAFDKGGLALLPSLSGKTPSVVVVNSDKQAAFVESFNQKVPEAVRVLVAYSADEAKKLLEAEIAEQISLLGGTTPGAFKIRALVADPASAVADALRQQLGDKWVTAVTPAIFDVMTQKAGLGDIVNQIQQAFLAFSKAA